MERNWPSDFDYQPKNAKTHSSQQDTAAHIWYDFSKFVLTRENLERIIIYVISDFSQKYLISNMYPKQRRFLKNIEILNATWLQLCSQGSWLL